MYYKTFYALEVSLKLASKTGVDQPWDQHAERVHWPFVVVC